jgi:hypothetical protein
MLVYIDCFSLLGVAIGLMFPLVLLMKKTARWRIAVH